MQKIYYYDHRVYVVYLVFLSWAGCNIEEAKETGLTKDRLYETAMRSLQAVYSQHVVHKDVRAANMLLSKETNSVMLIDFERARLLDLRRLPLAPVVPNKRAWAAGNPNKRHENSKRSGIVNECGELKAIFR
jgi:serine/threonine protein kinase